MFEVRCASCKRIEAWDGTPPARVAVRQEGGARRPAEHPALAAWRTLSAVRASGATVLGPCEACGQPLSTDEKAVAAVPYVIDLPGPDVLFDGRDFLGASGPISGDEARRRIEAALPPAPPVDAGRAFFTTWAAGLGLAGVVLWVAALSFVVFFLVRGAQTGLLWGQRGTGIYQVDLPEGP